MELSIKPHPVNCFPLGGILVKSPSLRDWFSEIQRMQLSLTGLEIYPIPGLLPNTVWGCLLLTADELPKELIGRNEWCQHVHPNLLIAERAMLFPAVTEAELSQLFARGKHLFHPEFGLTELREALRPETLLQLPESFFALVTTPRRSAFIPDQIRSFQVQPVAPEETLKRLEETAFPKKEELRSKPLNVLEKGKLLFYKALFGIAGKGRATGKPGDGTEIGGASAKKPGLLSRLFGSFGAKLANRMQQDFENLEERNRKELDKLMKLFKDDPLEALKYAIPLNGDGTTTRGPQDGELNLSRRWSDYSLSGRGFNGSGNGTVNIGDHYYELQNQYRKTAQALIEQGEHQKAAFVYMKLLKEPHKAGEALELGHHYQEAAAVFMRHDNKEKAAGCYEKGNMTNEAIGLYIDLNRHEKAGDLYVKTGRRKEADIHYRKVVDEHLTNNRFLKASGVVREKIHNPQEGQTLLLEGWRQNSEAVQCMNTYFSQIPDSRQLKQEIETIYAKEVKPANELDFMKVIKTEYAKEHDFAPVIRGIAYEIVARQIHANPAVVSELKAFNKTDNELVKDTMRFVSGKRK